MKTTTKTLLLIAIPPLITGCTQWVVFDAYRLIIVFCIPLVIAVIALICKAVIKK